MHQGRPYGLHVIGGKLTDRDEAFVSVTAKRFSNLKDTSLLDSSRMVYDLPDGGYIVVQDMGGNFRVVAHKSHIEKQYYDGMAFDFIPMLYSGVVLNTTPLKDEGVKLRLTETTRNRLARYSIDKSKPDKEVELQKFKVKYNEKFSYFEPAYKGNTTFTQYHKQRATWYSGAMSEVVQLVGGYGRQDNAKLPDNYLERQGFKPPKAVLDKIRVSIANKRLPAYTGFPDFKGQYQYEYRYDLCNGVGFDTDGKPWLLQIDRNGLYAMPLPLIPATTTVAFRQYAESVADDELLYAIDRFGGLPSGENFPRGNGFQSWLRAGVIIKLCDTKEFYKHNGFYLACGWSFNSGGTEAFNTCYQVMPDDGKDAHAYKIKIKLTPAIRSGWVDNVKKVEKQDAQVLNNYIESIFSLLVENTDRERAIKYKLSNYPTSNLIAHARVNSGDVDFWDNLIMPPIANHYANMVRTSSGSILMGDGGFLKFPEFTGLGCESFDLKPSINNKPRERYEAIVFGGYINDQLKVIKMFADFGEYRKKSESTYEEVMIIGQWDKLETSGNSRLMGSLYTSDFDDRRSAAPNTYYTKIEGEDLGYGNPLFLTPSFPVMWGTLRRYRYYTHKTDTINTIGDNLAVAACVPALTRDCMLYAFTEHSERVDYSSKLERKSVQDPTMYGIWTYDPLWHYVGQFGVGEPRPTIGDKVYANYTPKNDYTPTKYNEYADNGNWYGVPAGGYVDVSAICEPYTSRLNPTLLGGAAVGGESPQVQEYENSNTEYGVKSGKSSVSITVAGADKISADIPDNFYWSKSPTSDGGAGLTYFYKDASWITCGKQKYSSISDTKPNGLRLYWGSTKLADHKSAHCFIGVINE